MTIHNVSEDLIYSTVALSLNHEGTVLYPSEHRTWTQKVEGKCQTINIESCAMRRQLGFICEGNMNNDQDTCLDTEQSICHSEVHSVNQTTLLVYVSQGVHASE